MTNPAYYEFPIIWESEDAMQFKKLGIDNNNEEIDRLTIGLNEIVAFNPSYKEGETTIRTSFGVSFIVNTSYEKFKKFFEDKTGIVIYTYES